jgi:glycosyltransferase involved in cell wall biosynthesis
MHLVLFTHPSFLGSQSHLHFGHMLVQAYSQRGHSVQLRQPRAVWRQHFEQTQGAKWAGYVDQYLIFPAEVRRQAALDPANTFYVFCDQALGPWVPLLAHRPHVVHCHDFLALRSALGELPENPTSFTGRLYQRYIRAGFRKARHFISISEQTRADLHRVGLAVCAPPLTSEVIYNGLNQAYGPMPEMAARGVLQQAGLPADELPMLLHVGGGQWYKNTVGVVLLYAQYVQRCLEMRRPVCSLWMVSPAPSVAVQQALQQVPAAGVVRFYQGLQNNVMQALYASAQALLFPSLAEGFGWPIAEALACGCRVITTGEAPMTEVGGPAAIYLPRLKATTPAALQTWAAQGAERLLALLAQTPQERARLQRAGLLWAARFAPDFAVDNYLRVYQSVLSNYPNEAGKPFAMEAS